MLIKEIIGTTDQGPTAPHTGQIHRVEIMETIKGRIHQTETEEGTKGRPTTTDKDLSLPIGEIIETIEADPCLRDTEEMTTISHTTTKGLVPKIGTQDQIRQATTTGQISQGTTETVLPRLTNQTGNSSLQEQTR